MLEIFTVTKRYEKLPILKDKRRQMTFLIFFLKEYISLRHFFLAVSIVIVNGIEWYGGVCVCERFFYIL